MHQRLKERLTGAAVLVILAVIFIPMILTDPVESYAIKKSNIPAIPDKQAKLKLVPITDDTNRVMPDMSTWITQEALTEQPIHADKTEPVAAEVPQSSPAAQRVRQTGKLDPAAKKKDKAAGLSAWVVQLGSFSTKGNADQLSMSLRKAGFPAFVEPLNNGSKTIYRVRAGPELLRSDADVLLKKINAKMKIDGVVLRYP